MCLLLEYKVQILTHRLQWISEVLHFCQGLPIILVGCKNDLRHDPKTIEELAKTSQKPVTPEQVRLYLSFFLSDDKPWTNPIDTG